jgi:hypothetical protein
MTVLPAPTTGTFTAKPIKIARNADRYRWQIRRRGITGHRVGDFARYCRGSYVVEEQMRIDIDALSEAELVDLNHRIVERLRFLHQIHAHQAMLKFSIGDRVTFEDGQGRNVEGTLTRYNRKSVTVIGADGGHWNIAPGFLRKVDQAAASKTPNIIALPQR